MEGTMKRWCGLALVGLILLASCGPAGGSAPFYELVSDPARYDQQELSVLGFYYAKDGEQLLVVGVRTDDGFQNPVPLGDALWVDGMPDSVLEQLNAASGAVYGMVQIDGRFETGGSFGPQGSYPSRLVITDPASVTALEAAQMEEAWVPDDLEIANALSIADLFEDPERYSDQTIVLAAYYYWTPKTWVLAEGIRSLDGVHNAVPIGKQVWVEGFPPDVSGDLNVLENNVHGLVRIEGRFETRGEYGTNKAYPYRIVVSSAEAIGR
jgi:hypothetical protein